MVPREDEEFCRESFDRFLRHHEGVMDLTWVPFPRGDSQPPDFFLSYGGSTYAVEVTAVMTQYDQDDGRKVSEEFIWNAVARLTDEVERETTNEGILRGGYVLTLAGPFQNFFESNREIRKQLRQFIASTREVDETPQLAPICLPCGQKIFLNKFASEKNWVAAGLLSDGGGWNWCIVEELKLLVEHAVTSKAHKLRGVPQPWVLLLLDRYHFARRDDYQRLRNVLAPAWDEPDSDAKAFHSIYLINRDREVFPLLVRS